MNPESDHDLKQCFHTLRETERKEAPAWRPELLEPPHGSKYAAQRMPWRMPACAAVVVALGLLLSLRIQIAQPRLSEALPVLLDAPAAPLFTGMESSTDGAPSDFLLPAHLTLQMP